MKFKRRKVIAFEVFKTLGELTKWLNERHSQFESLKAYDNDITIDIVSDSLFGWTLTIKG